MKWNVRLARALPYDGEKVWTGDWFAAALYPGPRTLMILRPSDTPFPTALDSHRQVWSPFGQLREDITAYNQFLRTEERKSARAGKEDVVLDGVLAVTAYNGYTEFPSKHPDKDSDLKGYPTLYCDDLYTLSVFKTGEGTKSFLSRRKRLSAVVQSIDSKRVMVNKYTRLETRKQFEQLRESVAMYRKIGLILRRDVPYLAGKTGDILKVEPEEE